MYDHVDQRHLVFGLLCVVLTLHIGGGKQVCTFSEVVDSAGSKDDWKGYKVVANPDKCKTFCRSFDWCTAAEFDFSTYSCYLYRGATSLSHKKESVYMKTGCTEVTTTLPTTSTTTSSSTTTAVPTTTVKPPSTSHTTQTPEDPTTTTKEPNIADKKDTIRLLYVKSIFREDDPDRAVKAGSVNPLDTTKSQMKDDTTTSQTQDITLDTTALPPTTTISSTAAISSTTTTATTTTTTTATTAEGKPTNSATTPSIPMVTRFPPVFQPYRTQNPYNPYSPYYPTHQYPQYRQPYPKFPRYPPYQVPSQVRLNTQIHRYTSPKATKARVTNHRLCFNREKFPNLKLPEDNPKYVLIHSVDTGRFSLVAVPQPYKPVICVPVSYRGKVPILHLPAQNTQAQYNQYNQQQQFPFQFPGQGGPQFPFQNGNQNQFLPRATVPVPIDIKAFLEKDGDIYSETTSPKTTIAGGAQTTSSTPDDKVLGSNDTVDTNNTDSQSANITGGDGNFTFSGNQGSVNESIRNITFDLRTNQTILENILNITDPLTKVRLPGNSTYTASSVMHLRRNGNSSSIKTVSDTSVDNSFVSTNTSPIRLDVLNETDDVPSIDINADISQAYTHSTKSNVNDSILGIDTVLVSKTIQPTIKGKVILSSTEAVQPTTAATVTESNRPTSPPRRVRPPRYGRHRPIRKKPNRNRPKKTPKSKPKRRRRPRPTPDPMAKYKGKHPMRYARPRYWRRRKNPRPIRHPSSVGRKYRSRLLRSQKKRERALRNSYS
ncbi:uncharacterized protein [Haliotis cracherodii]|uniref:uncharacterized protein n=1 Tax=Haliotis cracherodii TaxID=6455 RepID=UPI0039E929D3